jgi:hypothetical protein
MHQDTTSSRGRALVLAIVAAATFGAYQQLAGGTTSAARTSYGAPVQVGNGTARTYITIVNGKPTEVGVSLTEAALTGLPTPHSAGGVHEHGHSRFDHVLPLPEENPTPFRHAVVNWNPAGHEPPGIYDTPHFDVHFYTIENADRLAIDPSDPEYQSKAERTPAPELIPEGYILPAPMAFARMGVHWVDPKTPELNGKPFTATFIYGSWDGKVIFAEPMFTKAFLESKPQFSAAVPAPAAGRAGGPYPSGYSIRWDAAAKEYRITLTGLTPGA